MFTATWPKEVRALAQTFMNDPTLVKVGPQGDLIAAKTIEQIVNVCQHYAKSNIMLASLAKVRENSQGFKAIVFTNTKMRATDIANICNQHGFRASPFHGDITQSTRERTLDELRRGSIEILVATDAASRGLDVDDISVVVNYDFPLDIEAYIHRIGRTGRRGKNGIALTLFTDSDATHSSKLIDILKTSSQIVSPALEEMASRSFSGRPARSRFASSSGGSFFKSSSFGGNDRYSSFNKPSYGGSDKSFGGGDRSYGGSDRSFGGNNREFGERSFYGSNTRSFGNNARSTGEDKSKSNDKPKRFNFSDFFD